MHSAESEVTTYNILGEDTVMDKDISKSGFPKANPLLVRTELYIKAAITVHHTLQPFLMS